MARRLLGERYTRVAGRAYRAIFVDLDIAAAIVAREMPAEARVLDVGGGDGEHLNRLLDQRADIRVTTIDIAAQVGGWIDARHEKRVERCPSTTLEDYLAAGRTLPDVLLVSDVVHHIPLPVRARFFATLAALLRRAPGVRVIVKDVEPGHFRATLGYLSDRFVSGDRTVSPISREELIRSMRRACEAIRWRETPLFDSDCPNYAVVFWR